MKEDMIYEWIKEERIYYFGKYTNIYLTKQYYRIIIFILHSSFFISN